MLTLGSLFDGSGGFPLAGAINGITPVWSSEIEAYPLRVTAARFPNVPQLGSVLEINGGEIRPANIVTFGSPCQDLSVAGKQKGIHDGERSCLFFEAIRIAKEMRARDRAAGRTGVDIRPRFLVWENVPEPSPATAERTSGRCLKPSAASPKTAYQFLDLRRASGNTPAVWSVMDGASHGGYMMLNTGECPSVARESTLSQILQANVPEKYFLSAKACAGILRRAEKRGKELPGMLREALEEVVELSIYNKTRSVEA